MTRKRVLWGICVICLILLAAVAGGWWMKGEKLRFAKKLGAGINLGNSLDATNVREYRPDAAETEYETFWGNPGIEQEQFRAIRAAGFRTVRIPVTWEEHIQENGEIADAWMERVQEVVDMALEEDLYVILDTHHETWLDLQAGREEEIEAQLRKVWLQIAERFCDYDERLLFEGMNEPRLRGSEHEWDAGTEEMRAMINRLNAAFVETVRSTGKQNERRYLLICPYATNSEEEAMAGLEIPDGNIMVSIHAYLPYGFCQDTEGTAQWDAGHPEDVEEIDRAFQNMRQLFIKKGVPVVLTEFGCIDKNNLQARLAWLQYYKNEAEQNGIPCIWWDNGSSYQLLDREKADWVYPELVEELTGQK